MSLIYLSNNFKTTSYFYPGFLCQILNIHVSSFKSLKYVHKIRQKQSVKGEYLFYSTVHNITWSCSNLCLLLSLRQLCVTFMLLLWLQSIYGEKVSEEIGVELLWHCLSYFHVNYNPLNCIYYSHYWGHKMTH